MKEISSLAMLATMFAFLLVVTLSAPIAHADSVADAASIAQHGNTVQENANGSALPPSLGSNDLYKADIEAIQERSRQLIDEAMARATGNPRRADTASPSRHVELFVSLSLGDAVLREIFQEASARDDVSVIFRGVPEGESLTTAIRRIHRLIGRLEAAPNVVIDPTKFRQRQVTAVPELVLVSNRIVIARAKGVTGIEAFLRRVDTGRHADMGVIGPVQTIAEPDLIDVMQKRLTALDLRKKKTQAMQEYMSKVQFIQIPAVTEEHVRRVDPAIYVTRDITDALGNVLATAGTRINPLDKVPFAARIVVFDATDAAQRRTARMLARGAKSKVILLATRLDREAAWNGLRELEKQMRAPVYLLTPEVRDRFHIERTVSVIEAKGSMFEIREVPPTKAEEG